MSNDTNDKLRIAKISSDKWRQKKQPIDPELKSLVQFMIVEADWHFREGRDIVARISHLIEGGPDVKQFCSDNSGDKDHSCADGGAA